MNDTHRWHHGLRVLALIACLAGASGCEVFGWLADGVAGGDAPPITVKAEYFGLENESVAVLVAADTAILYEHPLVQLEVATFVSQRIADNVEGATVVDPRQVVDFQQRNIYWDTLPYSEIAGRLEVTRLVVIDLVEYHLREPGNVNLWRGRLAASMGVAEVDGERPNDLAYQTEVSVVYPPDRPVGVVKAEQQTIRFATLALFSRAAAGKFHDHKESREP